MQEFWCKVNETPGKGGNIAEQELREKIVNHLSVNIGLYDCQGSCPDEVAINPGLRTENYCNNCFADQIRTLIKEDYVKLSEDQSLPKNPFNYEDECREYTSYSEGQHAMLKVNFRKVEL